MLSKFVAGMAVGVLIVGMSMNCAAQDAAGCKAAKLKSSGKKSAGILKAAAKQAKSPDLTKLEDGIAKVQTKFSDAFAKAEDKGGCEITGDAGAVENQIDETALDIACGMNAGACDCGSPNPRFLSFTTVAGSGNCGVLNDGSNALIENLACSALYFGGGTVPTPLPSVVPDYGASLTDASCCLGKLVRLKGTSSNQTGSNRNCTNSGCLYGPPLPVVNGPALSTCLINSVANNASGILDCSTGQQSLDIPLYSTIYLTGDELPNRCDGASGVNAGRKCATLGANPPCSTTGGTCVADATIQPCPVCNAGKCNGGPNDGATCTGTSAIALPQYPTSHDCPPTTTVLIGVLPIPYALSTGNQTKSTPAAGAGAGIFCGFCRDTNGTTAFKNPAQSCKSSADCAEPFEDCTQLNAGAFGKGAARSISETGTPTGAIATGGAPLASTLISVFCIPPTFNGIIDSAAGLPGPGAAALQGQAQLLP